MDCLSDRYGRIRDAAAHGLAHRGPSVLDMHPDYADMLIDALEHHSSAKWGSHAGLDSDSSPVAVSAGADWGQRRIASERAGQAVLLEIGFPGDHLRTHLIGLKEVNLIGVGFDIVVRLDSNLGSLDRTRPLQIGYVMLDAVGN